MKRAAFLFAAIAAFAQPAAPPAFEVAAVKLDRVVQFGSWIQYLPGGRFHAISWIKQLIQKAYDVKDYQVIGGPSWIESDRYDIDAKAGKADATEAQMLPMLQTLLVDRFQLKIRRESKEFPVYDLQIAKGGAKLRVLKPGDRSICSRDNSEACGIRTMAQLADWLGHITGRPVLDKTDIAGDYDVLLNFDVYEARNQTAPAGYEKPPLFAAIQEQLGLKLEAQKEQIPVLVIESIQRPTEN